jgi:lysophospholipase L1-like esterase
MLDDVEPHKLAGVTSEIERIKHTREDAMTRWMIAIGLLSAFIGSAWADGLGDNLPEKVRQVPPAGIEISPAQRSALEKKLKALDAAIAKLRSNKDPRTTQLLPDVIIFQRAVHDALKYNEFFNKREIPAADKLLDEGLRRAEQLSRLNPQWINSTGLIVRGFISRIDGSVQPYGLVVPASYSDKSSRGYRVDIWFHGRGERTSESGFLSQRMRQVGNYAPANTIVLHPYGRYSNAFKFAGEVDVLEALESVKEHYQVDPNRISVRGFSMGGAGCWQMAVHYSDRWFAANPGAGFSETPEFLKFFQKQKLDPTWFEKKLWRMYDCTDWAANLRHLPTIAYSGELDIQKQAADIMEKALAKENLKLLHIIGPKTKHRIHGDSKIEIERRMNSLAVGGRQRLPKQVTLVTYTLKYNRMHWVTADRLARHWEKARIDASIVGPSKVKVKAGNVTALTLSMPAGLCPLDPTVPVKIDVNGWLLTASRPLSDRSWRVQLILKDGRWSVGTQKGSHEGLVKRHDLQGPIDDAFMDSFVFVRPTGKAQHVKAGQWADSELTRGIEHWRRHFRGYARVKDDSKITDADIASSNLILWGDPSSNAVLKRIIGKLPIQWNATSIKVGGKKYSSKDHALIMIYPNPLNPKRYVVLNSSFTYREFAYLNNARQVPMLPDWAVIDLKTPPGTVWPGKVVAADFFNDHWQLVDSRKAKKPGSDPTRFESAIKSFEAGDQKSPPPQGAVLFAGSSSIRMWHPTLKKDMAPMTVIGRGFGGSTMNDLLYYADRIVIPYKPRAVVIYEGDNDTNNGVAPVEVRDGFVHFAARIHAKLPNTRIYFLPIKPSVSRWKLWPKMNEANMLIKNLCETDKRLTYVDTATPILNAQGKPMADVFKKDNLHLNAKGYAIWSKVVMEVVGGKELQYETGQGLKK